MVRSDKVERVDELYELRPAEKSPSSESLLRPPPMQVLGMGWWGPKERRVPAVGRELVKLSGIDISEVTDPSGTETH